MRWKVKKKTNFKSLTWLKFTKCLNKCSCEGESPEVSNESHHLLSYRDSEKKTNGNSGGIVSSDVMRKSFRKIDLNAEAVRRLGGNSLFSSLWCINNEPKHFISVSIVFAWIYFIWIERGNSWFFSLVKTQQKLGFWWRRKAEAQQQWVTSAPVVTFCWPTFFLLCVCVRRRSRTYFIRAERVAGMC